MKYHINNEGNAGVCSAEKKECPFGSDYFHYETKEDARKSFENFMNAKMEYPDVSVSQYYINLPENLSFVIDDLSGIGKPLIVGGTVRDSFIGVESKDVDIEVHNVSIEKLSLSLKNMGYSVDEVGKQFGVLKVSKRGFVSDLDISVPRWENKTGKGHQSFQVSLDDKMTVRQAAIRRDFTFNAVMYDPKNKILIDPFNGREDFKNNVIKHVSEKFGEDPLRVLRGVQFAGRFNMRLDPKTAELCEKLRVEYEELSSERVQIEWEKLFRKSVNIKRGFEALQDSGWDDTMPGLRKALMRHPEDFLKNPVLDKDKHIMYPAVIAKMMDNNSDALHFMKNTILGNDQQKIAISLWETKSEQLSSDYLIRKYAANARNGFSFEKYDRFSTALGDMDGRKAAQRAKELGVYHSPEPDFIQGRHVLELTERKPGPWLGKLLKDAKEAQFKRDIHDYSSAVAFAKKWLSENH